MDLVYREVMRIPVDIRSTTMSGGYKYTTATPMIVVRDSSSLGVVYPKFSVCRYMPLQSVIDTLSTINYDPDDSSSYTNWGMCWYNISTEYVGCTPIASNILVRVARGHIHQLLSKLSS